NLNVVDGHVDDQPPPPGLFLGRERQQTIADAIAPAGLCSSVRTPIQDEQQAALASQSLSLPRAHAGQALHKRPQCGKQLGRHAVLARMSERDVEWRRHIAYVSAYVLGKNEDVADVAFGIRQLALIKRAGDAIQEGNDDLMC